MPILRDEDVARYNATRNVQDHRYICQAPFRNMYFNVMGQAAACWLTFFEAPKYPEHSIHDIWFGDYYKNMRDKIAARDLSDRCRVCERNIQNGIFTNILAKAYDSPLAIKPYPSIMEFELSNKCNLECAMCNGRLSSTVRKNRDNLPEYTSPYDEKFVDQLEEFIPHLDEARFNGGEPFLQDLCWKAWDRIISIKDSTSITIATNGTVWSPRVADVLSRGNFRINLSLDGMSEGTYESIRKNSKFARVMTNIKHFGDYCRKRGTIFSIMVNPMRPNWQELPQFVEFCNANGYHLWFNTIYRPFHLALWTLSSDELKWMYKILYSYEFKIPQGPHTRIAEGNVHKFRLLLEGHIKTWIREQEEREKNGTDHASVAAARRDSKLRLTDKMRASIKDPIKLDLSLQKLSFVENLVSSNVPAEDFYHFAGNIPENWLAHDLEHKSAAQMAEETYYRAEYY